MTYQTASYLKHGRGIEQLKPDEQVTIDGIIDGMTKQNQIVDTLLQHVG